MLIFIILFLLILFIWVNQPSNTKENFGCGSGKACCRPGYYGESDANCSECPKDKPSSPFSHPGDDCTCKNNNIKSCFACKNKCAPYNINTRMCTPIECNMGETCKVINNVAKCVID